MVVLKSSSAAVIPLLAVRVRAVGCGLNSETSFSAFSSSGLDSLALPDWAIAILDEFDAALPGPVKRLLMLEGSIVFTKAA